MKILVVQETDWIGRNPIMHHRMLEALSAAGDEVTVIDYDIHWHRRGRRPIWQRRMVVRDHHKYYSDSKLVIIRPGMLRLPVLARLSWLVGNWRELLGIFRSDRPDVVVAYGISNALLAAVISRHGQVRFVYHLLDALHTLAEPAILRPIARVVESMVARRADKVIVINQALGKYAQRLGARPSRIDVLPVGWTAQPRQEQLGEQTRTELGIRDDELLLLFIGWLYPFSGLRELTLEFAKRRAAMSHVKVLVVGHGDQFEELQRIVVDRDLSQQWLLLGQRPPGEIPGYVAAADCCLLPALRTPAMEYIVPAKVGEYIEFGKPVIATRLPGIEEEFGRIPGMIYIEKAEEVVDRVEELLNEADQPREAARRLGSSFQLYLAARPRWERINARFRKVLSAAD